MSINLTSLSGNAFNTAACRLQQHNDRLRTAPLLELRWMLVACFVLLLGGCLAQAKQKFCGRTLTETMDSLCVNGFNDKLSALSSASSSQALSLSQLKRAVNPDSPLLALVRQANSNVYNADSQPATETDDAGDTEFPLQPLQSSIRAHILSPLWVGMYGNVFARTRREQLRSVGVYDECCLKQCTYLELVAYCRPN